MRQKLNIYRLLDIKPNSAGLLIIILPPIYSLWLLAIGRRLLAKYRKSDVFFSIIASLFFILNTAVIIALPFLGVDFSKVYRSEFTIFGQIYFSVYFLCLAILTNITVRFDRRSHGDVNYYSIANFGDYIRRFFAFVYWPFFIWTYQKTVNEYNK